MERQYYHPRLIEYSRSTQPQTRRCPSYGRGPQEQAWTVAKLPRVDDGFVVGLCGYDVGMGERLKVKLAGGHMEYLDVATTSARGLESLIEQGRVAKEWLPTENGKGVIRVGAIVAMSVEGKADQPIRAELDTLTRLDDERRLAGKPPIDDNSLERRIH